MVLQSLTCQLFRTDSAEVNCSVRTTFAESNSFSGNGFAELGTDKGKN
jgi:hypothetical protein